MHAMSSLKPGQPAACPPNKRHIMYMRQGRINDSVRACAIPSLGSMLLKELVTTSPQDLGEFLKSLRGKLTLWMSYIFGAWT